MGIESLSVKDMASIESVVSQIQKNNTEKPKKALIRMHIISLVCALGVVGMEIGGQGTVSSILRLTQFDPNLFIVISAFMYCFLGVAVIGSFFVLGSQAKKENMSVDSYMKRFSVIRRSALLSDIFVQSLFIMALLALSKGIWVSPLLVVLTGHFVLQGHLFRFSTKISMIIAAVCTVIGGALFYLDIYSVVPALAVFIMINLYSLYSLKQAR